MATILLIEPDRALADTYEQALTSAGHEVVRRTSAEGGIHALDLQAFDMVILELQLSLHNGVEFLYELRSYSDWQALPVIVHTFTPRPDWLAESAWDYLQVSEYLYKPTTTLQHLIVAVERQLVTA